MPLASATAAAPRTSSLELVKELARGSVGVVHQARNPQQNRFVALRKFEVPEWLDDANQLIQKILAEAKAASALDHPNIAKLHTCGYKDFTLFMTAEFVEGQTLRELMTKRQPEMSEVLQMTKQLLAALDYAHSKGVCHNFLNPNNIKVLPDGTLKLLDFGLLRDKNLLTQIAYKEAGKRAVSFSGAGKAQAGDWRDKHFQRGHNHLSALHGAQPVQRTASGRSGPQYYRRESAPDADGASASAGRDFKSCTEGAGEKSGRKIRQRPTVLYRTGRSRKKCAGCARQQHRIHARLSRWAGAERKPIDEGRAGPEREPEF